MGTTLWMIVAAAGLAPSAAKAEAPRFEAEHDKWHTTLDILAGTSRQPGAAITTPSTHRWMMTDLADLVGVLGLGELGGRLARRLNVDPATLRELASLVAEIHDVDLVAACDQVDVARQLATYDSAMLAYTPPRPDLRRLSDLNRLDFQGRRRLLEIFLDGQQVYSAIAHPFVRRIHDPTLRSQVAARVEDGPPDHQYVIGMLALEYSTKREALASTWLWDHDDIALRRVAAEYFSAIARDDAMVARIAVDPDQSIRSVADEHTDAEHRDDGREPSRFWTCAHCASTNDLLVHDCPGCEVGRRPKTYRPTPIDQLDF